MPVGAVVGQSLGAGAEDGCREGILLGSIVGFKFGGADGLSDGVIEGVVGATLGATHVPYTLLRLFPVTLDTKSTESWANHVSPLGVAALALSTRLVTAALDNSTRRILKVAVSATYRCASSDDMITDPRLRNPAFVPTPSEILRAPPAKVVTN